MDPHCNNTMQVVNKVRGKLSKLERKTLSALIVIDVHARDVAVELGNSNISSESDFEWMSQLRCVPIILTAATPRTVSCFLPASQTLSCSMAGMHLGPAVDLLHVHLQGHSTISCNIL